MLRGLEGKRLLVPVAVILLVGTTSAMYIAGGYLDALPLLMKPTAQLAFILFAIAFAASSLMRLVPNQYTRFLMRNRRYIGLSFAMVHFTHLVLVLSSITWVAGQERGLGTLVPGAIAYAFLALMTVTSNNAAVRLLGPKRWKWLHKIGSYYLWLVFLVTTLPPDSHNAWSLLLCLAVLGLRIAAYRRGRTGRSTQ